MQASDFRDLYELEDDLWWFRGMREITASFLDPILTDRSLRRIADLGCGTGINIDILRRYSNGGTVLGIDVSGDAINFCRTRGSDLTAQASATALPFPDDSLDVATSFDVLVQIPGETSDLTALSEMYRVLKPGGVAFIRVAAYQWMRAGHDRVMNTQRRYSLGQLVERVGSVGLVVERASYANTILFPIAAAKRLLLERTGMVSDGSDVRRFPTGMQWLDPVFRAALNLEARLLRSAAVSMPFGLSALCVARKPQPEGEPR